MAVTFLTSEDKGELLNRINKSLTEAKESGEFNGITPHIGENGNWFIGDEDTGVSAAGETTSITVDDKLNKESTNPIQNKTVAEAVDRLSEQIADQQNEIDNKQPKGNYVKSVNGNTPNENGDVTVIVQAEAPTFVGSVDEMVDTSKSYVNTQTGTIWVHRIATYEKEVTVTDNIEGTDDNPYIDNARFSSSGDASTQNGYVITPYIDLTKEEYQGKTIELHLEGAHYAFDSEASESYIMTQLRDSAKNILSARTYTSVPHDGLTSNNLEAITDGITVTVNGDTSSVLTITVPASTNSKVTVGVIGYLRCNGLGTSDASNVYITYQDTQTVTEATW